MSSARDHKYDVRRRRLGWPANLWLVPSLAVGLAMALFVASQAADRAQHAGTIKLPGWIDQGGATDALALLSATAGGIITTLGLVLSITVVVFTIVSSQFGQRLLREFMRDRGTQITIGVFAATFIFNLLTMLSVSVRPGEREFVPWVSIWVSLVLVMSCMGMLIFYINHVAVEIQVGIVIEHLVADFRFVVSQQLSLPASHPDFPGASLLIPAPESGYLQSIDYGAVASAAAECRMSARFLVRPGCFLLEGSPIAEAKPDGVDGAGSSPVAAKLAAAIASSVAIGERRNLDQDPEFAIAQITEIGERAMSPAVNDPNTMFTCVDWVGDCIRVLVESPRRDIAHRDPGGRIRLLECPMHFDEVVADAFAPLRQVAGNSSAASIRLLNTIASLAPFMTAEQAVPLATEADLIHAGFVRTGASRDGADVDDAHSRAIAALKLGRRPSQASPGAQQERRRLVEG
jgi:uncharacterized membrane protein